MIEAINEELREAVRKHLPGAIGEELQQLLKQAQDNAARVKTLEATLIEEREIKMTALNKVHELSVQLSTHQALDEREQAIDKRERDQFIYELKADLKASESSRDFARQVALGLVRNTDFREVVHHTSSVPVPVTQNGYTSVTPHTSTDRNEITKSAS